ncbi:presenilin family protein [Tieghemostelium lacteum]|uniref:Presenilin n=1 Tax=Tieghemostelium lacteum TaxID=361077 RepID=A0A151ZEF8_TIELA|nr:presenilin family protein [Tieghemostelium lacteum]|eukprot:KYQ92331.1 presenilin family protein [Tieghemostelium lacteum]
MNSPNITSRNNNDPIDNNNNNNNNNNSNNNNNNNNIKNHYNVNNISNIESDKIKNSFPDDDESYDGEYENNMTSSSGSIPTDNNNNSSNSNNNNSLFNIFLDEKNKKSEEDEDSDFESEFGKHEYELETPELVDYSESIVNILIPVCITMLICILLIRTITMNEQTVQASPLIHNDINDAEPSDSQTLVFNPIINSIIFLAVIILSTFIMVVLYKFKFMKALYGWLIGTSILLLGVFGGYLFILILIYCNVPLDYITFVVVIWNFSAGGMVCIYYYAPRLFHRAYLISIAVLMALFLTRLPEWTTWAILALVSIYDIFAVLCPGGPLKQLIDTAKKRGEEIPALIYNASVYIGMANLESNDSNQSSPISPTTITNTVSTPTKSQFNQQQNEVSQPSPLPNESSSCSTLNEMLEDDDDHDENQMNKTISSSPSSSDISDTNTDHSIQISPDLTTSISSNNLSTKKPSNIKLGLGDFVFYSVLVGRAALNDMITVCTCFIAVITGLFLTLFLLALLKRALPALPMSIGLGILFYFITKVILTPYLLFIGSTQVFI